MCQNWKRFSIKAKPDSHAKNTHMICMQIPWHGKDLGNTTVQTVWDAWTPVSRGQESHTDCATKARHESNFQAYKGQPGQSTFQQTVSHGNMASLERPKEWVKRCVDWANALSQGKKMPMPQLLPYHTANGPEKMSH